jgi:hypothetical protein
MSDDDAIVRQLTNYGDYGAHEAWQVFTNNYLTKTPAQRIVDLRAADTFIETYTQEHTGVTKELGSLVNRKRELESIHRRLREAGR